MFVDEARIQVASGRGGDGAVTFRREKYRPRGGPDGGDGGSGGSVVLIADRNEGSLRFLKDHPHQRASPGDKGASNNRSGGRAEDRLLHVPPGTTVRDEEGTLLADLASPGDQYVAAAGGRGGRGNAAFTNSRRRAPRFGELGEPGVERWLRLEIRLIADIAVVGFPNAGKSTLVAALSSARPKVASYPFTTLEPTLGVVERGDDRLVICDVPGLIEGAHAGKGLGIKFLRHAQRASVFLHLIDVSSGRDPRGDHQALRRELETFDPTLTLRPEVVGLSKSDAASPQAIRAAAAVLNGAFPISSVTGEGLDDLVVRLLELVKDQREARGPDKGFELFRTEPSERLQVEREGEGWRVRGPAVERWVAMTDLENDEAVAYLQSRLGRTGLEKALAKAGAAPGDDVTIGKSSFEWRPDGSEGETPVAVKRRRRVR